MFNREYQGMKSLTPAAYTRVILVSTRNVTLVGHRLYRQVSIMPGSRISW